MVNFKDFKNSRKDNLQKLTDKINQMSSNYANDDDRYWQPTVDKLGNAYAEIRFLPAPDGEDVTFVRLFEHAFEGDGGWYIEKCLSTLKKDDPVMEMNSVLWDQGEGSEGRKFVSGSEGHPGSKRKLYYISNVYIVDDPEKPDNNGKVFLFKYGQQIFDKIDAATNPPFPDQAKFDPFDLWDGATFKLKIRKVEGRRNYTSSEWDLKEVVDENGKRMKHPRGALFDDDAKLEKIWRAEYPLQPVIAASEFKSYDALKARLDRIMGRTTKEIAPVPDQEERVSNPPQRNDRDDSIVTHVDDDADADVAYFAKLKDL